MDAITIPHGMETEAGVGLPDKKLGMWVFLCSEVMFFTGLIGGYIVLRFGSPMWPAPGTVLNVPLTAFNTFLLICSSVTMVKAFAAIQQGDQSGLKKWLLATIVIGAIFVGIQAVEYTLLSSEHFVPVAATYAPHGRGIEEGPI